MERGLDQLLRLSHVASPDELSGLVADTAALFHGGDAVMYLADLQQRTLLPFGALGGSNHEEHPHALGVDSTLAGRAFQHMQLLTQSSPAGSVDTSVRVWLPLLDGSERLGVLGLTLPATFLVDTSAMQRLHLV